MAIDYKHNITEYRHHLGFQRCPKYLADFKKDVCGNKLDAHHLAGSVFGKKYTDFLLVPLTRQEHEHAEKHMAETFDKKLELSVWYLVNWAKQFGMKSEDLGTLSALDLKKFINELDNKLKEK